MSRPFEQRGKAIIKRLPPNARVAEVGVLIGVLSEYILRHRKDVTLYMIDSWQTADKQPAHYRATGDAHANHFDPDRVRAHRREAENRAHHFPGRARIMAMTSVEAATKFPDGSLDHVFVDADHSYIGVKTDLQAWVPKIRPGGWIGGHDYKNPDPAFKFEVEKAVDEWAAATGRTVETDANFTWFARV